METVLIPWNDGNGNIVVVFTGMEDDDFSVSSDTTNDNIDRKKQIKVRTTKGFPERIRKLTVKQPGLYEPLEASDGILSDSTGSDIWALKSA